MGRRPSFLAAAALLLAPAASASTGYAFGRTDGNIAPFTVSISPAGAVTVSGPARVGRSSLTAAQLATLRTAIEDARLGALPVRTVCVGTLPDFASSFIRTGTRTVAVRGSCSAAFTRAWKALAGATRLDG